MQKHGGDADFVCVSLQKGGNKSLLKSTTLMTNEEKFSDQFIFLIILDIRVPKRSDNVN